MAQIMPKFLPRRQWPTSSSCKEPIRFFATAVNNNVTHNMQSLQHKNVNMLQGMNAPSKSVYFPEVKKVVVTAASRRQAWNHKQTQTHQYTEQINIFAERGEGKKAKEEFENVRHLLPVESRTMAFNTVLKAFANAGDSAGATKWLNIMVENGVRLNGKTFGKLAESCSKTGDFENCEKWLRRMSSLRFGIDSVTKTILLSCAAKSQSADCGEKIKHLLSGISVGEDQDIFGNKCSKNSKNKNINSADAGLPHSSANTFAFANVNNKCQRMQNAKSSDSASFSVSSKIDFLFSQKKFSEAENLASTDCGLMLLLVRNYAKIFNSDRAVVWLHRYLEGIISSQKKTANSQAFVDVVYCLTKTKQPHLAEKIIAKAVESGIEMRDIFHCALPAYALCSGINGVKSLVAKTNLKPTLLTCNQCLENFCLVSDQEEFLNLMQAEFEITPDIGTFTVLINGCLKQKDAIAANKFLAKMSALNLPFDRHCYNTCLNLLAKARRTADCRNVFNKMVEENNCFPDAITFTSLIDAHSRNEDSVGALFYFNEMKKSCKTFSPDKACFQVVLNAFAAARDGPGAEKFLSTNVSAKFYDVRMFSSVSKAYGRGYDPKNAERFLQMAREKNNNKFKVDAVFYNVVMDAYSQIGLESDCLRLFNAMVKDDTIAPDRITFNCLIGSASKRRNVASVQKYFRLMQSDFEVTPADSTKSLYVTTLAKCGRIYDAISYLDSLDGENIVENSAGYSINNNVFRADLSVFNSILEGLSFIGDTKTQASFVKKMHDQRITPNLKTYFFLIRGAYFKHDAKLALELLKEMSAKSIPPDVFCVTTALKTCVSRKDISTANAIVSLAKSAKIAMNSNCFQLLLELSESVPDCKFGFNILTELEQESNSTSAGVKVENNDDAYERVLRAASRQGDMSIAEQNFAKIGSPGQVVFGAMISGYSRRGQMDLAEKYFLEAKEIFGNNAFQKYEGLIDGYAKRGESAKALQHLNLLETQQNFQLENIILGASLRGDLSSAKTAFQKMQVKNARAGRSIVHSAGVATEFKLGERCLSQMVSVDLVSNVSLMKSCAFRGDLDRCESCLMNMLQNKKSSRQEVLFAGNNVLKTLARSRNCHAVFGWLEIMRLNCGKVDADCYFVCLEAVLRSSWLDKASKIVQWMRQDGVELTPRMEILMRKMLPVQQIKKLCGG